MKVVQGLKAKLTAALYATAIATVSMSAIAELNVDEVPSEKSGLYFNDVPPKVMIGLAHVPDLVNVPLDKWTFVRNRLDGVWINGAGTGHSDVLSIIDSIRSNNYWFIGSIANVTYDRDEVDSLTLDGGYQYFYDALKDRANNPKLVVVNDYVSKDSKEPLRYYGKGYIRAAKDFIESENSGVNPFDNRFYITTRAGHFKSEVYNRTYAPNKTGLLTGRGFSTMQNVKDDGGWVYERSPIEMSEEQNQETYLQAYNRAKEMGADFIWLANRGNHGTPRDYTTGLFNTYQWFAKHRVFPDRIVIINYSREALAGEIDYLKMLPMENVNNPNRPAVGSFIGSLYWAIVQRLEYQGRI